MSQLKPTRGNVFRSTRRQDLTPADLLMVAFHRGTAILYMLLAVWGAVGAVIGVESLRMAFGPQLQTAYGVLVAIVATVSAYGAMYFPQRSRLELFAAAALISLMVAYPAALLWIVTHAGEKGYAALLVLSLTVLVIPSVRVAFVYQWMVTTAAAERGDGAG